MMRQGDQVSKQVHATTKGKLRSQRFVYSNKKHLTAGGWNKTPQVLPWFLVDTCRTPDLH